MKALSLALLFSVLITGCASYTTGRYSASTENIMLLRDMKVPLMKVGPFTATKPNERELMCRGIYPIRSPDGEPFEDFIRKAFIDELRIANAYSVTSDLSLTGKVELLDFSSTEGLWTLSLSLKISNGQSFGITERYTFPTSFFDDANACGQAAQALIPTIQNVINRALRSPDFANLVKR